MHCIYLPVLQYWSLILFYYDSMLLSFGRISTVWLGTHCLTKFMIFIVLFLNQRFWFQALYIFTCLAVLVSNSFLLRQYATQPVFYDTNTKCFYLLAQRRGGGDIGSVPYVRGGIKKF